METPDPRSALERIVSVTKRFTRVVQVLPFVYLLVFAIVALAEPFLSDAAFGVVNNLFYVAPGIQAIVLGLSRLLRLCRWHKIACLLPMSSQAENYIDGYIFQFTQNEITFMNMAIGIISIAFIVFSIRHFFHGRQRPGAANA